MQTWRRLESPTKEFQGGTVTIGNFDGLHRGHQALLAKARAAGGPVTLITFDPHPLRVLRPDLPHTRIFPRADLVERLPDYGVDLLFVLPFDHELARLGAEEFLAKYVAAPFRPRHFVAGHDFALGRARGGDREFLRGWCARHDCELYVIEAHRSAGEIYSSRVIRELIRQGEVGAAADKLGRFFYLRGEVGSGAGRGNTIGVPTMNLKTPEEIIPAVGVYATRTRLDGRIYRSVTNIGVNPTFGGDVVKIETHVPGATLDARGKTIDVEFVKRLRPEMKFASIEDLKNQIKNDILKANEALDDVKPE